MDAEQFIIILSLPVQQQGASLKGNEIVAQISSLSNSG